MLWWCISLSDILINYLSINTHSFIFHYKYVSTRNVSIRFQYAMLCLFFVNKNVTINTYQKWCVFEIISLYLFNCEIFNSVSKINGMNKRVVLVLSILNRFLYEWNVIERCRKNPCFIFLNPGGFVVVNLRARTRAEMDNLK